MSYAIGVAKLVPQLLEAFGTERSKLMSEGTNNVPKMEFDCRPGDHEVALAPREPMYQETATYCHFGREPYPKDGKKEGKKYASTGSAEATAALKACNHLPYAIGVAKPLPLFRETYGTELDKLTAESFERESAKGVKKYASMDSAEASAALNECSYMSYAIGVGKLTAEDSPNVLKMEFDCHPGDIAVSLAPREPMYQESAAPCHYGREPYRKEGKMYFEWEYTKDVKKYAPMRSAEAIVAPKGCNYMSYARGVVKPLPLFLETYGTEQDKLTAEDITNVMKSEFDWASVPSSCTRRAPIPRSWSVPSSCARRAPIPRSKTQGDGWPCRPGSG
ncbi:unnamed protein product [Prorocentrum cordatum]|uniref:S-adenosylmethionine synthetase C-terminal domain-containing protein n=1 Tax=Prorocentrum cordatum TaxID=2364126 RepID=A0ABN9QW46_9DINO|nr:unnamed protein product [Polarella glacialis]